MSTEWNPLVLNKDKAQTIEWNHFMTGPKYVYDIEFLVPMKAIQKQCYNGTYMLIAGHIKQDQELNNADGVKTDALCVINLPVKTFSRAWLSVSRETRLQLEDMNNVRLKFYKKNSKNMFLKQLELTHPTTEQIEFVQHLVDEQDHYGANTTQDNKQAKVRKNEVY
jgi:hypothetical protein